jgi:3',5'-cyclic AMP phosphodiesterase CpdA
MAANYNVAILSDIHYASPAEQARGDDYEYRSLNNPLTRVFIRAYRRFIWLRFPLRQNHLLDRFIDRAGKPDLVVANGDYACDTLYEGVSDEAAFQSARECLQKLRAKFSPHFRATFGDHELGKLSFFGGRGGMRLRSWRRAQDELALQPFWRMPLGNYVLLGVTSSLIALPVYEPDTLPNELAEWREHREKHVDEIRRAFSSLNPNQRVILFCHDPTALPFLWRDEIIRGRLGHIEHTIIGHLHSNLIFRQSRLLSGLPPIRFLGHTAKRMTTALSEGRHWRHFRVKLCPALAGIELLKDGGFLTLELDSDARLPAKFRFHSLKRLTASDATSRG